MTNLKHFVLTLLAALVSVMASAYDFEVDGIYYKIISEEDLTCEVANKYESGYEYNSSYSGDVVIPSTVTYGGKTYSVTSIGDNAFYASYYSSNLTSIVIPNSVTSIGKSAFYGCNLTNIEIPNSVTSIREKAFSGSSLTSVEIPNSVISIGESAFSGCWSLASIVIPNSVTSIGDYALCNCPITSIVIPNSVTNLGKGVFYDCTSLPIKDNLRYVDTYLVEAIDKSQTSYNIKEGTKFIGTYAFSDCDKLTSLSIPNGVITIDQCAFAGCKSLPQVFIPNSVTSIDYGAFFGCSELTSVTIPNSVTSIRGMAFWQCNSLTSVNIPSSVTTIGQLAFECKMNVDAENPKFSSIDGVLFNKNQTELIKFPLNYDDRYYVIPNNVTTIATQAFNYSVYDYKITSITIPSSVTSIGDDAFCDCKNLRTLKVRATDPANIALGRHAFEDVPVSICRLIVPEGSKELYAESSQWKDFTNIEEYSTNIDLSDAEAYTRTENEEEVTVNYTRNFKNTNWQPLYLPFALSYDDWKDYADVAYINNVHQWDDDKDGTVDRTILEFITKTSGSIEPNKPYVIRPKQTGEVTFTSKNTTLYAAPATDGYVDCMSTTTKYTLYGTYQKKTDMYENGYYAMAGGGFKQADNASVTLSPFRIYMKIEDRTGAGAIQNAPKRIGIMVDGVMDDNDETGIQAILPTADNDNENFYNLTGQKIGRGYKGIAIKNGKKYLIK